MGSAEVESIAAASVKRAFKAKDGVDPKQKSIKDVDGEGELIHLYPPLASKRGADKRVAPLAAVRVKTVRRFGSEQEADEIQLKSQLVQGGATLASLLNEDENKVKKRRTEADVKIGALEAFGGNEASAPGPSDGGERVAQLEQRLEQKTREMEESQQSLLEQVNNLTLRLEAMVKEKGE